MATPAEIREHIHEIETRLNEQHRLKAGASKALKKLENIDAPSGARKARQAFGRALRRVRARASARIGKLRKAKAEAVGELEDATAGAVVAVKWALAQAGKTEVPAGSNDGPFVRGLWQWVGYSSPVPWCGCFVCVAAVREGLADTVSKIRWGYVPSIMADARAGANGLKVVTAAEARAGDLACLFGGTHVAMLRGKVTGSSVPTVEGNTSPGSEGSQDNGGCVAIKTRSLAEVALFVRPDYP